MEWKIYIEFVVFIIAFYKYFCHNFKYLIGLNIKLLLIEIL
jgi:hypothetical protein